MAFAFERFAGRLGPAFLGDRRRWDRRGADAGAPFGETGGVISAPCLGTHGRWGNTVLQYLFLRTFADRHGLSLETPSWLGTHLFGLAEPAISAARRSVVLDGLSAINERGVGRVFPHDMNAERARHLENSGRRAFTVRETSGAAAQEFPFAAAEMEGPFLVHSRHLSAQQDALRGRLRPAAAIGASLQAAVASLRSRGRTIVGLHVRRGDFGIGLMPQNFELVIPASRYREWLDELWPSLDAPVLFLASDDDEVASEFARFAPVTARSLGAVIPDAFISPPIADGQLQRDAAFFADWHLLTECDVLLVSNSTFSFSAALLNRRARRFFRPTFEGRIVAFDPWNSEPLLFADLHPCLAWELLRRLGSSVRIAGWKRFPEAALTAIIGFKRLVVLRIRCALHARGPAGLAVLADPRLYLASAYRPPRGGSMRLDEPIATPKP